MKFYADLHIHSHYSRATSRNLNLEHLHKWAQLKGIHLVGTGDFVHPGWLAELQEKLEPAPEEGLFRLKPEFARTTQDQVPPACRAEVRFLLSVEISNIYKRLDSVRKVHNLVFAPSFEVAGKIQARLERIGNIRSDGRPILGLDSRDLLELTLEAGPMAFLVPAHIWTPWFSALGSKSGFDRMADCFGDLTSHIFAAETGLSSDPPMNWRLSQLDPYILISNSDAHSPANLGREANLFDADFSYPGVYNALADPDNPGLLATIEFFPEEGKYHFDGHRACKMRLHPSESRDHDGRCPVCGKPVTVGVLARVETLADRAGDAAKPPRARPYTNLIPLAEVIADAVGRGAKTKTVQQLLHRLLGVLGNELFILQDAPIADIEKAAGALIAEGIRRMRDGEVHIKAGYDGEYGTIQLFAPDERKAGRRQISLLPEVPRQQPSAPPARQKGKENPLRFLPGTLPDDTLVAAGTLPQRHVAAFAALMTDHASSRSAPVAVADLQLGKNLPDDLNAAQWRAVTHSGGHLLIVAGPGTGKTHTLTHRIAHFVHCFAAPEDILAITFTNKAAEEMQQRLQRRLQDDAAALTIGTFHSFCLNLLRGHSSRTGLPRDFRLANDTDIEAIVQELWPETSAAQRRRQLDEAARWKAGGLLETPPPAISAYNEALRRRGLLDFDDLLTEALRLIAGDDTVRRHLHALYRYIFVDEYQDINPAQHALLKLLVHERCWLTAIGDPNQAIYGFRGADVGCFDNFADDFPGAHLLYLADNYRSAKNILSASSQIISRAKHRDGATAARLPAPTAKIAASGRLLIHETASENAEAEYVVHQIEKLVGGTSMFSQDSGRVGSAASADYTFGDIAVLYRLKTQRQALEQALQRSGIPYQLAGDTPLIASPSVVELLTLLELADGRNVEIAHLRRLLLLAAPGIGEKAAGRIAGALQPAGTPSKEVDLASLQDVLPSALRKPAIAAGERFLLMLRETSSRLSNNGLLPALQHLLLEPVWQQRLATHPGLQPVWQRLIAIARLRQSGVADFVDYISLQGDHDVLEPRAEKVCLLTLHAAKGLEFPVVFITGCEKSLLPLALPGYEIDVAEERRLFYVGMTRAREQLYLLRSRRRTIYGKSLDGAPSPFLADIEEALKEYEAAAPGKRRKRPPVAVDQLDLFA